MTALRKYARLEATGLWRPDPGAQRREVVVSVGDATLVITDLRDQALTHWSLAAIARANPGEHPAIYHPDGDSSETLELSEDAPEMIEAIETLRRAIDRKRPRPGRLRWLGVAASIGLVAAMGIFWLPGALRDHTLRVVPDVKRAALGTALLDRIERISGVACANPRAADALENLSARLLAGRVVVMPDMPRLSLHLPGDIIVLDARVIEDQEDPDVAGGYILGEIAARDANDPLREMLSYVGLRENFRLITTGFVDASALDSYAEYLMRQPETMPPTEPLLALFARSALHSTPYAYARDPSGETTLSLIEGDPMSGGDATPLLTDPDWLRLQDICGS